MLEPDTVRGIPLDMDQYTRLFGTARIPTDVSHHFSLLSIVSSHAMSSAVAGWKLMGTQGTLLFSDAVNFVRCLMKDVTILGIDDGVCQIGLMSLIWIIVPY